GLIGLLSLVACGNSGSDSGTALTPSAPAVPAQPPAMQSGDYNKTITIGSEQRSYILHVPQNYDGSKPLPLVYILHGHGGTAGGMAKLTGMSQKADQENFFVAYLQGVDDADGIAAWNTGMIPSTETDIDDLAFVRQLTQDLETQVNVDAKRIYAGG